MLLKPIDFLKLRSAVSSGHVDPDSYTSDQVRKIRGALFSAYGPVPDFVYGEPPIKRFWTISWGLYVQGAYTEEQMIYCEQKWKQSGYTHAAIGSFVDPGYHGYVPPCDFRNNPDAFADRIQRMWDNGIIPIYFVSPDNWTLSQIQELEFIHKSDRWQKLIRAHVIKGFEPSKDTPNAEYVEFLRYGRDLFPKSLSQLHMCANFDAPGNNDDLTPGTPKYIGNAGCWQNVAPYLHGFLGQYGEFYTSPADNPEVANEFIKLFKYNRFVSGYAGWPTHSAWGNSPIDYYYAEGGSYAATRNQLSEEACKEWGDLAINNGAVGVLDSLHMEPRK